MCLGIPGKVIKIEKDIALVNIGGANSKASIKLTPDVKIGDYVILHAGFAIQILDCKEALETLKLLEEL